MMNLYLTLCGLPMLASIVSVEPSDLNVFDKFHQSDYKVKFERVELVSFNKNIIKQFKIVTYKYNRTLPVVNITVEFNVEVGSKLEVILQMFKFASNEYRLFPVRFQANLCFAINKDLAGLSRFRNCGNFSGCPLQKNKIIHICKWTVDESKLPPHIPNGKYRLDFQMMYESTEAAVFRAYAEAYRPIPYDK